MRLISAVLLSVGAALIVGVLGRLNSSLSIPPQFSISYILLRHGFTLS